MRGSLELDLVRAGKFDAFPPPIIREHDLLKIEVGIMYYLMLSVS